jgi:hypothetical protein
MAGQKPSRVNRKSITWEGGSTNASFIVASAFGAAVLISSAVFAQVPADPSNPNENLPDADDVVSLAGVAALK